MSSNLMKWDNNKLSIVYDLSKLLYLQGDLNGLNPGIIVFLLVSITTQTSKNASFCTFKPILISPYNKHSNY